MDTFGGDRAMAALMNVNQSGGEEEEEEAKVSEVVVVQKETDTIKEEGPYPKDQYPLVPEWDDPNDIQQEPPVDPTYCRICLHTPCCLFLQWQDKLETSVNIMYPEETNRAK
jgi:hypothetical protein